MSAAFCLDILELYSICLALCVSYATVNLRNEYFRRVGSPRVSHSSDAKSPARRAFAWLGNLKTRAVDERAVLVCDTCGQTDRFTPATATAESSLAAVCKGCCKDRMRRHSTRRAASQRRQRTAVSLCSPSVDAHFQSLHRSSAWNSLPSDIQSSSSLSVFRQLPKTFLFRQSFPDIVL